MRAGLERTWSAKRTWLEDCFGLGIKRRVTALDYVYIRIRVKGGIKKELRIPAEGELERGF